MTNMPRPKRPKTIDGTPARVIIANRILLVKRVCRAYSERYTALAMPRGNAVSMVPNNRYKVPTMAGKIPPSEPLFLGKPDINSQFMAGRPFLIISNRM
jgi:hypothetical protein